MLWLGTTAHPTRPATPGCVMLCWAVAGMVSGETTLPFILEDPELPQPHLTQTHTHTSIY